MKHIFLGLVLLSGGAAAKPTIPEPPKGCADEILLKGYCKGFKAPIFKGPINITFYISLNKAEYPSKDDALDRFLDFVSWPSYAENSEMGVMRYQKSSEMDPIFPNEEPTIHRHYANYEIKSSVVGWQQVRTMMHYQTIDEAYPGALSTTEYWAQLEGEQDVPEGEERLEGAVGIKEQHGSIHQLDCSSHLLCDDDQHLIVYTMTVVPEIDILPSVAGQAIQDAIESTVIGMYFPQDGDVL